MGVNLGICWDWNIEWIRNHFQHQYPLLDETAGQLNHQSFMVFVSLTVNFIWSKLQAKSSHIYAFNMI